jgi:hypothetical protein
LLYYINSDPLYDLKGAARPAREFYTDPKLEAAYTPVDIYTDFKSHLYDHPGRCLASPATHHINITTYDSPRLY